MQIRSCTRKRGYKDKTNDRFNKSIVIMLVKKLA